MEARSSLPRIGWIGLGIMGRPMAENVRRAGFTITAYNRSPGRLEAFIGSGGQRADSAAEAARQSDIVVIMVSDTPDVEEVIFGPSGIAAGARPGQVIVDMSTISPRATRDIAQRLGKRGIDHLDAPVSGGESGAIAAALSIMVGGEASVFQRCQPLFASLGKRIIHMGPSGSGQATKLVNQVAVLGNLLATCQALRLAEACQLDLGRTIEAVGAGAGASWQLAQLGPKMIERDFAPGFPLRLARKDLRLILESADELGLSLPGVALVERLCSQLAASRASADQEGTQALIQALEATSRAAQ